MIISFLFFPFLLAFLLSYLENVWLSASDLNRLLHGGRSLPAATRKPRA